MRCLTIALAMICATVVSGCATRQAMTRLEERVDALDVRTHPIIGRWVYADGGKTFTRDFYQDGTCLLLREGTECWHWPFHTVDLNEVYVQHPNGTRLHQVLQEDGTLLIEEKWTATREPR